MARRVVERNGGDPEKVKQDPDYLKCQAAFKDFASTLAEKESRIAELEQDLATIQESVAGHKVQLESLLRDIEKVKQEKLETVADIITAKEERELSDMITGISQDRTTEELQEMRDLRQKAKAGARVSREMAGVDAKRSEEEFIQYAEKSAADSEFDALIGLTKETETPPTQEPADRSRLPEG
jgi:phage shock protein A